MKKIIKSRWIILVVWIIATILLTIFQPNINAILRLRGQTALNKNSPSVISDSILSKLDTSKGDSDIIVFYNKNKISDAEMNQIRYGVKGILDISSKLGISHMIDPFSMPEAKSSLLSKDSTTLMVTFKLDKGTREVDDIEKELNSKLKQVKAEHYFSGQDFINNDYLKASQSGVEKSAILTVVFILVVLVIMFKSIITPFVSLIAVAFSYLCSMGIVAQLIDKANFPITNLTQMLLVLILFGIGTDYNILLFNRFKEELSKGYDIDDAIVNTYKTAGKTIAFSILTVFIAFFSLIFAESPIYRSGVAVVIGVTVLLLEILTLTPFAMKFLGNKLFWPSKKISGHGKNKFWGKVSSVTAKYPIISVIVILLIIAPTIIFHQQKLNFNTVGELGDSQPSSKAFNLVSKHFGKGQAMPATVVIENNKELDNNEALSVIDNITERIKNIDGVKQVSSVTQPNGKEIESFYTNTQIKSVTEGLSKTNGGVDKIYDGLKTAQDKLGSADFSGVSDMVDGTTKLQTGVSAMSDGLQQIQNGIGNGSNNSQSIAYGINTIQANLAKMNNGLEELAGNYNKMKNGYSKMGSSYQEIAKALLGVKDALSKIQPLIDAMGKSYPNIGTDNNYMMLKGTVDKLLSSLSQITPEGIKTLNDNYSALTNGFEKANAALSQISSGLSQMDDGLKNLESGLDKASSGIGTIVTNMNKVSTGLGDMKSGQQKLVDGINGFSTFGNKLGDVNKGLEQISGGLGKTNNFLTQLNSHKTFFIPREALTNKDFKKLTGNFMSKNKKITKITVVLKNDPYSSESLKTIDKIKNAVSDGLKGSVLSKAKSGVSGSSAMTNDMNNVLGRDLNRATVVVLIGVFLVLVIVTRSLWEPAVITASLIGSYYAAIFIINFIFINLASYEGISSFVPFFAFIIVIALGVDYSIFLMMRFKEYTEISHKEAIVLASEHIGSVVMSAAIILGGTFATLAPSGLILLIELAIAVITGLIVLCFIMLPAFLPAMISLPSALEKIFSKNKEKSKQI